MGAAEAMGHDGRMANRTTEGMRRYWNERAVENAAWYVDTTLSFDEPDMERFLSEGARIVRDALDGAPVAPARNEVALEIGCGLGRVAKSLAERFDRVIGVDISPEMLERARQLVDEPRVELLLGDGASLAGVEDASVDLVLSFTVLQHIPDPKVIEAYLREAGRVLRPGGVLVFQWNNEPGHRRWVVKRWWLTALQRSGLRPEHRRRHAPQFLGSRVPLGRIERALADGGLTLAGVRDPGTLLAWAWAQR
jgi:SAM-dependent methyltransferase